MDISSLPLPTYFRERYRHYATLTPIQIKALNAGVLQGTSLLACAPTASGKTLIATMAIAATLGGGKAIYLVPLKALAGEKLQEFRQLLQGTPYSVAMATGDMDSDSPYLAKHDLLILTTEKLDSLLRHHASWLREVKLVVVDEIHLLNDPARGPTLEIILILLRQLLKPQLIGLSATIGNPEQLAKWLDAELIKDEWRPVELKQGISLDGEVEFY